MLLRGVPTADDAPRVPPGGSPTKYRPWAAVTSVQPDGQDVRLKNMTAPEGTPPVQINESHITDARKSLVNLDWEGRRLEKSLAGYIKELKAFRENLAGDTFTVERIDRRLTQLQKFVVIP